jgi:uncharacterized membrane protein (UPF0127 family)
VARRTVRIESAAGVVCRRCRVADTFGTRLRGLMGRRGLAEEEGLLIRPANSIHTFFMRFPIDVVFVDRDDAIVKVVANLRPWRLAWAKGADRTLELPAGSCEATELARGGRLSFIAHGVPA